MQAKAKTNPARASPDMFPLMFRTVAAVPRASAELKFYPVENRDLMSQFLALESEAGLFIKC
jgi:hypothetical protein